MKLKDKICIVTGAASGIGLAMTMGLLKAGHDVTAVDRNDAGLDAVMGPSPQSLRERWLSPGK